MKRKMKLNSSRSEDYDSKFDDEKKKRDVKKSSDFNKLILIPIALIAAFILSYLYNQWLQSQVNKPFDGPQIVQSSFYTDAANLERYWGTYRPNLYFGLKTRSESPLDVGMMWLNQLNPKFQVRHWCDQGDGLRKYGWVAHDGRNFGIHDVQESTENSFSIRNSWVKRPGGRNGGDWSVKTQISHAGNEQNPKFVSVFFYFAKNSTGWIKEIKKSDTQKIFEGETEDLGSFRVKIDRGANKNIFVDSTVGKSEISIIKEQIFQQEHFTKKALKGQQIPEYFAFRGISANKLDSSNFIAYQVSGFAPFEFEIMFESDSLANEYKEKFGVAPKELKGAEFEQLLTKWHGNFQNKFESLFKLREKNLPSNAILMAQAALSNMLGGIGFFHGQSLVRSMAGKEPVLYWESNLYTAVPSRSFFPRGFLWDEGFHNILIQKWDSEITKDIVSHWLDLMNIEGWIPREVILGDEARAKVPQEFWIQNNEFANPPAMFLPLDNFITKLKASVEQNAARDSVNQDLLFLKKIYPRLKHWYNWFNTTQVGQLPFTYRWRGRNVDSKVELNAKTLTSGLDDYPRASHPDKQERHLDLRCWMALSSKVMSDIAGLVEEHADKQSYLSHYLTLSNNHLLDALHWSGSQYADYGLHSDNIKLVRPPPRMMEDGRMASQEQMVRKVDVEPVYQFVNSVGYVSLFPMLLQILEPDSPKLGITLDQIKNAQVLWTKYGLRSLARNAPLYDKRNTEHDPPYWRGAIWVNINYLTLKSLKYYGTVDGPHKEKALAIYKDLRQALIDNLLENYVNTGYIWEQYNDRTGKGQGSHPFTGWSALIVLILSENF